MVSVYNTNTTTKTSSSHLSRRASLDHISSTSAKAKRAMTVTSGVGGGVGGGGGGGVGGGGGGGGVGGGGGGVLRGIPFDFQSAVNDLLLTLTSTLAIDTSNPTTTTNITTIQQQQTTLRVRRSRSSDLSIYPHPQSNHNQNSNSHNNNHKGNRSIYYYSPSHTKSILKQSQPLPRQTPSSSKQISFSSPSLESIRHFNKSSPPLAISLEECVVVRDCVSINHKSASSALLIPRFWSLGGLSLVHHASCRTFWVLLDAVRLNRNVLTIGVLVRNMAWEKVVRVRLTWDHWSSFVDVDATFKNTVSTSSPATGGLGVDRFVVELDLEVELEVGRQWADLEFAVRYTCLGQEFWDNNNGENHKVSLMRPAPIGLLSNKTQPPSPSSSPKSVKTSMQHRQHVHPNPRNNSLKPPLYHGMGVGMQSVKKSVSATATASASASSQQQTHQHMLSNFYNFLPASSGGGSGRRGGGWSRDDDEDVPRKVTLMPSTLTRSFI